MNADLTFFETHVPIISTMVEVFIAVGWALLIGNCVFQALKSMLSGFGFDGENPHILLVRTGIFGFLLLASRQVCEIALGISGSVMQLLDIPPDVTIANLGESSFSGVGSAGWLLVIIFGLIMMFQIFKLLFEIGERYVVVAVLTFLSPLAFAMGGSKSTHDIFKGWVRMYASMMLMMILNIVFLKMILSAMATIPTSELLLPWLVLIVALARVARKIDSHIVKIGLNPAITGDALGGGFPGFVAYTVAKNMISSVSRKSAGAMGGSAAAGKPSGASGTGRGGSRTNGAAPVSNNPKGTAGGTNVGSAAFQNSAMSQNTVRQNNTAGNVSSSSNNANQQAVSNTNTQNGRSTTHAAGTVHDGTGVVQNTAQTVHSQRSANAQNAVNSQNKAQHGQPGNQPMLVSDNSATHNSAQMKHQNMMASRSNTVIPSSQTNNNNRTQGGQHNAMNKSAHTSISSQTAQNGSSTILQNQKAGGPIPNNASPKNAAPPAKNTAIGNTTVQNQSRSNHAAHSIRQDAPPLINNRTISNNSSGGTHSINAASAPNSQQTTVHKNTGSGPIQNVRTGTPGQHPQGRTNAHRASGTNRPQAGMPGASNKNAPDASPITSRSVNGTPPMKSANNNRNIKPIDPKTTPKGGRK